MSAHRRVSRRVCGWRVESGSRRSCGQVLVDSNAARSAFELAGVSSRRWALCGRACGERARGGRKWTRPLRPGCHRGGHAASGADERGQRRRTGTKCHRCSVAGRPRRRARLRFRPNDDWLTEPLWQRLSSKPKRIRRWCSWQSWSTNRVLQHYQMEQEPNRPGLRDVRLPKLIEQTAGACTWPNLAMCQTSTQNYLASTFWTWCDHFHEMALKQLLFLIKFATTLKVLTCKHLKKNFL